jgi:hypothetical protein
MGVHREHPQVRLPDLIQRRGRLVSGPAAEVEKGGNQEKNGGNYTGTHLNLMYIKFRRFVSKKEDSP